MIPPLPPITATPTPGQLQDAREALTAQIAGQPTAISACHFYQVVEGWVGPWGEDGYPIGFGLRYCQLFNANKRLQANPVTRQWVFEVTVLLQEELRDYLLGRLREGTLPDLTEAELRAAAFDSHSRAYTRGGLVMVALCAPELIPVIISIPAAEYDPFNPDFLPTIKEIFETLEESIPLAGQTLGIADEERLTRLLNRLLLRLDRGELNNLAWLERLTALLNRSAFHDQSPALSALALRVRELAERKKREVAAAHRDQTRILDSLREHFEHLLPGWWRFLDPDDEDDAPRRWHG